MDALKLAFDTIIVGALALPWLLIAMDLFLASQEGEMTVFWTLIKHGEDKIPPAVMGVLMFTMAYFLGAAISRVSGDFFNDDDLRVQITEDNIRAAVYCSPNQRQFIAPVLSYIDESGHQSQVTREEFGRFCDGKAAAQPARQIFRVQESALLLQGGDKTETLNQLRAQISVLRGATFDGLLVFVLCGFGLCGKQPAKRRLAWWIIPIALFVGGWRVLIHHVMHNSLNDPPFMEFTFIVLGFAGGYVFWKGAPPRAYGAGLLLSILLSGIAYFGWWWTEVLYDQQVLHSFYAQSRHILTPAP
jgi:hypothetical protein